MSLHTTRFNGCQGMTLTADVGGDPGNPPVLLLHGGGQTRHSWGKAARELARAGYHTIALDLRGHGDSDWAADGDYSLDAFIGDLLAVIATLEQPPALVGASLGGAMSLLALGEVGNHLARALVLVDVVPRMSPTGIQHIRNFMGGHHAGFANIDEAAQAVASYLPGRPRPDSNTGLMKNLRLKEDGRLYWHWDPEFQSERTAARNGVLFARMEEAARKINVPSLLVRGKQSDVVTQEGVDHLLELIPHAQFADIEGAGHMVAGDKNDRFNRAIHPFLDRHLTAV